MTRFNKTMLVGAVSAVAATWMISSSMPARATAFPGPDDFGYTGSAIDFHLRDVSSTGTSVSLADDQLSGAIALPFTFTFYGVGYNQLFISSNGYINFDGSDPGFSGCCSGKPLPQADGFDNLIAGYWEDLYPPSGKIRYQTFGTSPNREFVVGFYSVNYADHGEEVNFEMILHESGDIELQYGSAPGDGDLDPTSVG